MRSLSILAALLAGLTTASPASLAQEAPLLNRVGSNDLVLPADRYGIVVDLDKHELRFMQGGDVLWSAPVGTGTGLRLESKDNKQAWEFSTPQGEYRVESKELNPLWYVPEWYFVKNNQPIPPLDSPERVQSGQLGAAAIYLGHELAIHGTDKPELLGQRVSHGCIRMSNDAVLRLYHNVQIGTPIYIVGGDTISLSPDSVPPVPKPRQGYVPILERDLTKETTAYLVQQLEAELWLASYEPEQSRWSSLTHELIERSKSATESKDALWGILIQAGTFAHPQLEKEFATVIADLFHASAIKTIEAMDELPSEARDLAADYLVYAMLGLYPGGADEPLAAWPTRRVPQNLVPESAQKGWAAIRAAEVRYRAKENILQKAKADREAESAI